jgi:tagatose 1,6-diphosphate aldolase
MAEFKFNKYPVLTDGVIDVWVEREVPGNPPNGRMPAYHFVISPHGSRERAGQIDLRVGYTNSLVRYGGHIGYRVYEPFRGHRYAARACLLVKQVAIDHGMDVIWITCNPDNWPSRRTCEIVGCELVDIVDLPDDNDMYRRGERHKCRYRWILYGGSASSK